jgi:hypothetical protein
MSDTWPENCPKCGDRWMIKSRTMGRVHGQPHDGVCASGHHWTEVTALHALVHYTDHHGGTECGINYSPEVSLRLTTVLSQVTCADCACLKRIERDIFEPPAFSVISVDRNIGGRAVSALLYMAADESLSERNRELARLDASTLNRLYLKAEDL